MCAQLLALILAAFLAAAPDSVTSVADSAMLDTSRAGMIQQQLQHIRAGQDDMHIKLQRIKHALLKRRSGRSRARADSLMALPDSFVIAAKERAR